MKASNAANQFPVIMDCASSTRELERNIQKALTSLNAIKDTKIIDESIISSIEGSLRQHALPGIKKVRETVEALENAGNTFP